MATSPRRLDMPDLPPLLHQALLNPLLGEEELLSLLLEELTSTGRTTRLF